MHTFTNTQAAHALEVVLKLMKERRLFLDRDTDKDPESELDPEVFGPAIELNQKISSAYRSVRVAAEEAIVNIDLELGFAKPDLSDNKQVVTCRRYTGGLDIWRVYPLAAFLQNLPKSLEEVTEQCFQRELAMQNMTEDDLAPKVLRQQRDDAHGIGATIWSQLHAMGARDRDNPRCVVMMKTRIDCSGSDANRDFMQSRLLSMQEFPHAMGYLFYEYSLHTRIVRHDHVVFSTSRDSHVNVHHWNEERPIIEYSETAGYTCPVFFVTVL